jgi:hypothetical protein
MGPPHFAESDRPHLLLDAPHVRKFRTRSEVKNAPIAIGGKSQQRFFWRRLRYFGVGKRGGAGVGAVGAWADGDG